VIAGNLITEEYIPNTCAALADAGYVALAPNLYHGVPAGAQGNQGIAAASSNHDEEDVVLDMLAGLAHLRRQQFVDGSRIAALGFCFGGRIALKLATRSRDLCAVVAFHPAPRLERADVRGMRVPVQIHSGIIDRAAPPEVIRELGRHLAAEGAPHEVHLYEGADHGFLAYTRPQRYNAGAGMQAWDRTTTFLGRHLAPPNRS
jgi:carboxymethylenebutenolidase